METPNLSEEKWGKIYDVIGHVATLFQSNVIEKNDLIHDALLHVAKRLKTNYLEKGKFDEWVRKVTVNFCKDRTKDYYRKNTIYFEDLIKEPIFTYKHQSDDIKKKKRLELMEEAIKGIKPIDKQIIIGRMNKETFSTLATMLKKNKKTIIKHWKKTLIELNETINKKYFEIYGE